MALSCPNCGSQRLRMAHRLSVWERVLSVFGQCSVRCKDCGHRHRQGINFTSSFARCPKCMRDDLTDWEEKYYYPPRWQQAMLSFGAKAHRCAVCRYNFISWRRRRREFVPSWKTKGEGTGAVSKTPSPPGKEKEKSVA